MFTVGEFARLAQISVRTLHHYDHLGLLEPAQVDPVTGYRSYSATQFPRLNRILVLRDLGFTLEQIGPLLDDDPSIDEFRGMLRLREAQLHEAVEDDRARLRRVRALLHAIEEENNVTSLDIIAKQIPAMRVAGLSAPVPDFGFENAGPITRPLVPELYRRLQDAGVKPIGRPFHYWTGSPSDSDLTVHFASQIEDDCTPLDDALEVVDLPAIEAATIITRVDGTDADRDAMFAPAYPALARWIEEHGYHVDGSGRDVVLESGPGWTPDHPTNVVFEHQLPFRRG